MGGSTTAGAPHQASANAAHPHQHQTSHAHPAPGSHSLQVPSSQSTGVGSNMHQPSWKSSTHQSDLQQQQHQHGASENAKNVIYVDQATYQQLQQQAANGQGATTG